MLSQGEDLTAAWMEDYWEPYISLGGFVKEERGRSIMNMKEQNRSIKK